MREGLPGETQLIFFVYPNGNNILLFSDTYDVKNRGNCEGIAGSKSFSKGRWSYSDYERSPYI